MKWLVKFHPMIIETDSLEEAEHIASVCCEPTPSFSEIRPATDDDTCWSTEHHVTVDERAELAAVFEARQLHAAGVNADPGVQHWDAELSRFSTELPEPLEEQQIRR